LEARALHWPELGWFLDRQLGCCALGGAIYHGRGAKLRLSFGWEHRLPLCRALAQPGEGSSVSTTAQAGDLVQLQGSGFRSHLVRLEAGAVLQTHRGVIRHDDIIGQPWGSILKSHTGHPFYLFQPGLADLIRETKRTTQILYPKDIGYILLVMGVGPGSQVLEVGTGSGGLTTAFAYMVGENGHVFTYERNPATQNLAIANLQKIDLAAHVDFKLGKRRRWLCRA